LAGVDVQVEGVEKTYDRGRIAALRGVSLAVAAGEFVALTGPSGCGKSTLLNLIGALDRPDAGRVVVDGTPVTELKDPARYRRSTVGFVFQLHHLLGVLDAESNVEVPLIAAGVRRAERRRIARRLLEAVGLADRANHHPWELSGGERQRVAIARALANEPRLLLADEPTGALDSETSARVLDLIDEVRQRRGMTVLMVTYEPDIAGRADRVEHMADGRMVTPASALRRDAAG
jgi:ABC-type lipoprotein export system ATPase subunit